MKSGKIQKMKAEDMEVRRVWKSEEYAVRFEYVQEILVTFGLTTDAMTDVFNNKENRRFDKFMQDAWKCSWAPPLWVWLNPPYSKLQETILKVLADSAQGVAVVPDWKSSWLQVLLKISKQHLYYPEGVKFFELHGEAAGPLKWGVHVCFFCGFDLRSCVVAEELETGRVQQVERTSSAARRKKRRDKLEECRNDKLDKLQK